MPLHGVSVRGKYYCNYGGGLHSINTSSTEPGADRSSPLSQIYVEIRRKRKPAQVDANIICFKHTFVERIIIINDFYHEFSRAGQTFFSKELNVLAFLCVLFRRMQHSRVLLHSF